MIKKAIAFMLIGIFLSSTTMSAVYSSALSTSDIDTSPERVCMHYGDEVEMKDLCDWINICDDTGEVNSTHGFCTGLIMSDAPGREACPPGFHMTDDDESGLCYKNIGPSGCEYEDLILRPGNRTCGEIENVCQQYPDLPACTITINLGAQENFNHNECELTVPDYCFEPYSESYYLANGTNVKGVNLSCRDVNVTDFKVTIDDQHRHNFDGDYDGIGCESSYKELREILFGNN
jgi:hypothetical protein